MSKQKREQQKKRKREKARRERLNILRAIRDTGGEDEHYVYFNMEIYEEPKGINPPLSPEMNSMAAEANDLAHEGNYKQAISMLEKVNAKEPGRPMILYNIAAFHLALGDREFHDKTIDKLVKDFPEYFFGQMAYARRLIMQCQLDQAWEILHPIYRLKRLHIAELKAFAGAMILFELAKNDIDEAQEIHRSCSEICEGSFPSLDSFLLELMTNRMRYKNVGNEWKHRTYPALFGRHLD